MKIALIGNPNAGKSSIFNQLTGLRQKTGNFPGVTVDKKTGTALLPGGKSATVIDLPGAYSLYPNSLDERLVSDILLNKNDPFFPDAVIYIADVNNLERHLLLCTQLLDLELPVVMALTMSDIAADNHLNCDIAALEKSLGIPVARVNGRTGEGISALLQFVSGEQLKHAKKFFPVKELAEKEIAAIQNLFPGTNDYAALLTAHHYERLKFIQTEKQNKIRASLADGKFNSLHLQVKETLARYEKITAITARALNNKTAPGKITLTEKLDNILTHPVAGYLIFSGILFFLFQAIFSLASYPMDWIDTAFGALSGFVSNQLPPSLFTRLLAEGILPGIAGVCIFIPQITILFALIVFLEDVGYMSRAIYLSDNIMRRFGLNGRSIVSLFSGLACAVPSIMATRTITNRKERLITIMVTPLVSCSARIPVFTILVALVIPAESRVGIFNAQGALMFALYLAGVSAALVAAFVMKKMIKTTEHSFLVMELPSYKKPHWKNIFYSVMEKVKVFVAQAGKIILLISIALWALASYGPPGKMQQAEADARLAYQDKNFSEEELEKIIASEKMEASFAGHLGKVIEPLIRPLGYDWKIGIALITSFAAREVFVGTMATLYSVGSDSDAATVLQKLQTEKNPLTGEKIFTPAVALSLLIFYLFAMQCMSTLAVVQRETKSWKWALVQFTYMTILAYLSSFTAYQFMLIFAS